MGNLAGEFIGKRLEVLRSSAGSFLKITGKVIDETKNTFSVETQSGIKTVPKKGCVFRIGEDVVSGDDIMFRAEDRPRKLRRKIR